MLEFISSEINPGILEHTPVIFGSFKEGILEVLDSHIGAFRAEIVAGKLGAHPEPKACRSLGSFWEEVPIVSFCRLGSEVSCTPGLQESQLQDWIVVEVSRALREELPDIIECVTNRVVVGIERQASAIQAVDEVVRVTRKREIGLDCQLRKRKRTYDLARQSG